MKYFGKGWYFEPYRHSLSARGIKTSYFAKPKIRNWAEIFPTSQPKIDEKIEVELSRRDLLEAYAKKVLQKPVLEEGDRALIMAFFAESFMADIPKGPYMGEEIDEATGEVVSLGTPKDYLNMIRDLARQKTEEAIRQHDEYFSEGGREKLLEEIREVIADVKEEAELEPDPVKRQEIVNAEVEALAAAIKSTKEEIPLAFPEEDIRMELMKLGPLVGKTPEEIMASAPRIELPSLVKPLLKRELEPESERFGKWREARRKEFLQTLSPEEKGELIRKLAGGREELSEKVTVPVYSYKPYVETPAERMERLAFEKDLAWRGYGTPPPGLLPVYPKYWKPVLPKAPSPEEWGAYVESIRKVKPVPIETPVYLKEPEMKMSIPTFKSRTEMKKALPGIEHFRRQPGGSIELGGGPVEIPESW